MAVRLIGRILDNNVLGRRRTSYFRQMTSYFRLWSSRRVDGTSYFRLGRWTGTGPRRGMMVVRYMSVEGGVQELGSRIVSSTV